MMLRGIAPAAGIFTLDDRPRTSHLVAATNRTANFRALLAGG
jgi:hypothetical protein